MRYPFAAVPLALLTATIAASADDIPLVAIGLPFEPEAPRPVPPDHPLFELIEIPEIVDLPAC